MEHQELHPLGPFDIVLIAKGGKQFKAHRRVLSEASPFFKNLLESDMKENKEGVVRLETLTELLMIARFETDDNMWEEIAAIQVARVYAFGAAANGKVYIAGGFTRSLDQDSISKSCEMYNEMTNEWHFIGSLSVPGFSGSMVCVDGTLYVLGGCKKKGKCYLVYDLGRRYNDLAMDVECYDCEKDKWYKKTTLPGLVSSKKCLFRAYKGCSVRLFKGFLKAKSAKRRSVHDCSIM